MNAIGGVLRKFVAQRTRTSRIPRTATVSAPSDVPRRTTTKCGITFHSYFVVAPRCSEAAGVRVLPPEFNARGLYAITNPLDNPEYLSSDGFHALIAAAAKSAVREIERIWNLGQKKNAPPFEVHIFYQRDEMSDDGQVFYWPKQMNSVSV